MVSLLLFEHIQRNVLHYYNKIETGFVTVYLTYFFKMIYYADKRILYGVLCVRSVMKNIICNVIHELLISFVQRTNKFLVRFIVYH